MDAETNAENHATSAAPRAGVYGSPLREVVDLPSNPIQFSPLMPGASALEQQGDGTLSSMTMLAPPGTLERRYAIAQALRSVAPGGAFTALAPNDKGGTRLKKELQAFGCTVEESSRRHHRIVVCTRPATLTALDEALSTGGPQRVADLDLWSQPGVFSWDRIDPGTAFLMQHLPPMSGHGADFGCGIGILAHAVLASPKVEQLTLVDIDRRAVESAKRNVADPRVRFRWADVRDNNSEMTALDFVVMNAPFHDAGAEDKALALAFVKRAADVLRNGGVCWLVANRHLPYEATLQPLFRSVALRMESGGYKVFEARK